MTTSSETRSKPDQVAEKQRRIQQQQDERDAQQGDKERGRPQHLPESTGQPRRFGSIERARRLR